MEDKDTNKHADGDSKITAIKPISIFVIMVVIISMATSLTPFELKAVPGVSQILIYSLFAILFHPAIQGRQLLILDPVVLEVSFQYKESFTPQG